MTRILGTSVVPAVLLLSLLWALAAPPVSGDRGGSAAEMDRGGSAGTVAVPGSRLSRSARTADAAERSMGLRLKLPFPEGETYEVYQGKGGSFSHSGLNRYAFDFGLPEGTPVLAAAEGRVVRVKQDSGQGGTRPDDYARGNTVILDHGQGLFTQYLHLQKNSVPVREGDLVRAGQVIGRSGNTGFSSVPHLHFQVQDALGQSLPCRFVDVPGDGVPRSGQLVTSANDGMGTSRYKGESVLPPDVFAGNGILLENDGLPAHLLRTDRTYKLRGLISTPARQVAIFLMGSTGGRPVHTVICEVDETGRFTGELSLEKLRGLGNWSEDTSQSNPFALAIAPVNEDGSFWSTFSVPVTAR